MYILKDPLALLIRPIYDLIGNYGFTLIIVTVLIRFLTVPLTVMSQKSMSKTQAIQPEMMKLQEKYKDDKNKLTEEMTKLYQKHGMSPLSGCSGCLPLIVQMLVLFGFIGVIYNPLESIVQLSPEKMAEVKALAKAAGIKNMGSDVYLCSVKGVKEIAGIDFNFFGIDLSRIPSGNDIKIWLFPVLAFLSTVLSSYVTKKQSEAKNMGNPQAQSMSNTMLYIMPVMTLLFIGNMPVAMSLYWFVSTTLQILQQTLLTGYIDKKVQKDLAQKGLIKNDYSRKNS